jgi:sigma-B regulation protein RsbU (phosphoserine phosphatase)
MKILIAEDNLASQLMLKTTFDDLGHDLVVTGDGREACEIMLKPDAPKLAILDWMMPGMDGVEVCRKIREKKFADPAYLIVLTVRNKTEDIVKGLKAGANDYIIKPYNVEELQVRVGVGCRVVEMQAIMAGQIKELQSALAQIKTLRGLLPICMYCKKIRDDKEYWQQIEGYISEHSEAAFSHGICPDCYKKYCQSELDKAGMKIPAPPGKPF